ncbi:MAG: AraC family transcriptional regulator [Flavobacterium sp.]|nr:MAG: AraC family transcriptional regulator [Flavobacterium sp.]
MIFILALLNVLYKIRITSEGVISAENLWNPVWLLLGPILYYSFNSLTKDKKYIRFFRVHFVPFYIYFIFFCFDYFSVDLEIPWQNPMYVLYQESFFVIPLSLLGYAVKIFNKRKTINANNIKGELLFAISGFYAIIGVLYVMMYVCWGILNIDMGLDYRIFTYGFLLIIEIFILRYVYATQFVNRSNVEDGADEESAYTNSGLKDEVAAEYVNRILVYFLNDTSFLNPDISIESISKDLNIPKHHFSQLFNVHIGKNFYTFIAERRIGYALKRLNEEKGKLKIESLAYECGFNSKTSFNRYFKQITGFTPLEYVTKRETDFDNSILKDKID